MEEILELRQGEGFMVIGPSCVQVAEGSIEVFGKRVREDEKIVVKKYRAIPIETSLKRAVVNLVKGHEGRVEKRKRIGCEMWKQLAERIRTEKGNYLILGKVDSGKSSLTVFLVNRCLEKKLRVGIVDADLGQGDLGEPGLIGAAIPDEKITSLEDIRGVERRFIGKTSPHGVEEELENAMRDLHGWLKGKNCDVIFINFHGWVEGEGAHRHIAEVVKKTGIRKIIVIQEREELTDLIPSLRTLRGIREVEGVFLRAPDTFKRSTEDRRGIRERKFRKYFSTNEFTLITKYHGEIPIEGTEMFCWEKVHPDDPVLRKIVDGIGGKGGYLVYGERKEKAYRALIINLREKAPLTYDHITIDGLSVDVYTAGGHMGLVVGFRGEGGWEMGKLVSLRPLKRQWVFLCPVKVGRPFEVCLGRIIFDEEDIEYGSLSKGFFA